MEIKRKLKIVVQIIFVTILGYFIFEIATKVIHKKEVAENIKVIPKFEYQNVDGNVFLNYNLKKDTPIMFIYYNSECEFCNEETQMIKDNIENFTDFQLIFISFEKINLIKVFAKKYKLDNYDNVHFLSDTKITFATTFDVNSLPCLVLYDKSMIFIIKH